MGPITAGAIYLTLWWTVLFAVLPLGSKSYAESGIKVTDGGDPGAPVNPNLKKKFITTTWVSFILWAILMIVIKSGIIQMPAIAQAY